MNKKKIIVTLIVVIAIIIIGYVIYQNLNTKCLEYEIEKIEKVNY